MTLPLPKVVADVEPGGGIATARRGLNALTQSNLENEIKKIQAQYAPITVPAEAASKLAYANLMGPQFLAKLMGNTDILANIPDEQKRKALNMLYAAGSGQGTGNAIVNPNIFNQLGQQREISPVKRAINSIGNMFGFNGQPNNILMQQPNLSPEDRQSIANMSPGQSYVVQGNQPQEYQSTPPSSEFITPSSQSFPENVGTYKGIVEEGQESGKIRANDIKELNNIVFTGETNQETLNGIADILASPIFEQIRQVPLAGQHELAYYAKFGTPEQQNMVGQYYTLTGNLIKDSSRDFAGAFRKGEQQLLQTMKPSEGDMVDTARGKSEALSYLNKLLTERARLTSQIMNKYHVNKLQAQELADKEINGVEIRRQIHEHLNPVITIRNKTTGEVKTIPIKEARELGVPNV